MKLLSRVWLFVALQTVAYQAFPSVGFSRQEWVAISFSRGSSRLRDGTRVSYIVGSRFTIWATREALRWCNYCQNSLAGPKEIKYRVTMWPSNSSPNDAFMINENNVYTKICISIQKLECSQQHYLFENVEITQVSINRWMDK